MYTKHQHNKKNTDAKLLKLLPAPLTETRQSEQEKKERGDAIYWANAVCWCNEWKKTEQKRKLAVTAHFLHL